LGRSRRGGFAKIDDWRDGNRGEIAARAAKLEEVIARPQAGRSRHRAYFAFIRHPFRGKTSASVAERLAAARASSPSRKLFWTGQEDHLRFAFANAGRRHRPHRAAPRKVRDQNLALSTGWTGRPLAGIDPEWSLRPFSSGEKVGDEGLAAVV